MEEEARERARPDGGFVVPMDLGLTSTGNPSLRDMPVVLGGMGLPPPETPGKGFVLGPCTSMEPQVYDYLVPGNQALDSSPEGGSVGRESWVTSQLTSPLPSPVKPLECPVTPELGQFIYMYHLTVTPPGEKANGQEKKAKALADESRTEDQATVTRPGPEAQEPGTDSEKGKEQSAEPSWSSTSREEIAPVEKAPDGIPEEGACNGQSVEKTPREQPRQK